MTKLQKRVKAHNAARKRGIAKSAGALLKRLNPAKRITEFRVRRLKGGGVTVVPLKKNAASKKRGRR